jgi:hypothetical protein
VLSLFQFLFSFFPTPRKLCADNAFDTVELRHLCSKFGVTFIPGIPHYPLGHGAVERMNRSLQELLLRNDDFNLVELVKIHNSTPLDALGGKSPQEVVFGPYTGQVSHDRFSKITGQFKPGDLVMRKVSDWKFLNKRQKDCYPYHGPYVVFKITPTVAYLKDPTGMIMRVSPRLLKRYYTGSFDIQADPQELDLDNGKENDVPEWIPEDTPIQDIPIHTSEPQARRSKRKRKNISYAETDDAIDEALDDTFARPSKKLRGM